MNYINAQKEILTDYLKDKRVIFTKLDDKVVYGTLFKLYITPANKVGINFEKTSISEATIGRILDDKDAKDVYLSEECIKEDKNMIRCFKNGDIKIYVDEKYLKNFDLPSCTFKSTGATDGVFVYENEIMVGFVLPIRLKNS